MIEKFLCKDIESQIGILKSKILNGESVAKIASWKIFKSLYLYFLVQTPRWLDYQSLKNQQVNKIQSTQEFLKYKKYMDSLIFSWSQDVKIALVEVPKDSFLFFPEIGYFTLPINDPGCISKIIFTFAFPLFVNIAVVLIPRTAITNKTYNEISNLLQGYSVGLGDNCDRVVIPSHVIQSMSSKEIIKAIFRYRKQLKAKVKSINSYREMIEQVVSFHDRNKKLKSVFPQP